MYKYIKEELSICNQILQMCTNEAGTARDYVIHRLFYN